MNFLMLKSKRGGRSSSSSAQTPSKFFKAKYFIYTLNGKPVQAKPIGKGRYEVTDEKGNISYISHDGVKLKPEYVRNNP